MSSPTLVSGLVYAASEKDAISYPISVLDDIAEQIQNGFMSGNSNGIDWSLEIG